MNRALNQCEMHRLWLPSVTSRSLPTSVRAWACSWFESHTKLKPHLTSLKSQTEIAGCVQLMSLTELKSHIDAVETCASNLADAHFFGLAGVVNCPSPCASR